MQIREVDVVSSVNNRSYISNGIIEGEKVICKKQLLVFDFLNN